MPATQRRILLVDDEVAILLALKAILEINGFTVETAASVREAKAKLRTSTFHMVISDLRMEDDASGLEVLRAAKKAAHPPAVALLTAYPEAEEDLLNAGADQMLVKPMNTRDLLRQIEALLVQHQDGQTRAGHVPALAASAKTRTPAAARKSPDRATPRKPSAMQAR
jgi:DNA-binding response OmpR family regulator